MRALRVLVTTLTVVMICGLLVIVAMFVIRFSSTGPTLPETIALPDGTSVATFTVGQGWYAVVTTDDQILIFNKTSGNLTQTIQIDTGN